jgi:hypothetical protein
MTPATCRLPASVILLTLLPAPSALSQPVGTAFTYQGRLNDGGTPATGAYDLQLALFDAASGGAPVGPTLTLDDVVVTSGLFTVSLDFGAVFAGSKRWLEIRVRPGASTGPYTTLGGRQEMTPGPNAVFSSATPWTGITGKPAGFADDVDNDSGGDVTSVTAGTGLTGGGIAGALTIAVDFAGTGSATAAARSDHDHAGQSIPALRLSPQSSPPVACSAGTAGTIFYSSLLQDVCVCQGTSYVGLLTASACN